MQMSIKRADLKRLRKSYGLSQLKLAEKSRLPRWKIAHFEAGLIELNAVELKAVRAALVKVCARRAAHSAELLGQGVPHAVEFSQ
jgi:predicted transcriptional regulator